MKSFLLIGTLFLAVCVTPSTMMVNSEGKGNAMRYDGLRECHCNVRRAVHARPLRRGHEKDWVRERSRRFTSEFRRTVKPTASYQSVEGPAQDIGVRTGDQILQIEGRPVESAF
jgi:hypothetical protein